MQEISVCAVNLDDLESSGQRAASRGGKRAGNRTNFFLFELARHRIGCAKRHWTGSDGLPSACISRDRLATPPGNVATAFAPRMGNLNCRNRAVLLHESGDSREYFDVLIFPNAQVTGSNAPPRFHRRRFSDHQTSPANSPAPEMNQMPIGRKS